MNIKIVDSWLREYLNTNTKPEEIAKDLSLASISVDKLEKHKDDYVYDIEVTTNRVDLMSIKSVAREAQAVLSLNGKKATFKEKVFQKPPQPEISFPIEIINDPDLVNRIMAVVIEVDLKSSPDEVKNRLELSGIRSLNNLIDVTNYVMRETGHPAHVFDFDRLNTKKLIIRRSKKGEKLTTLDGKEFELNGGDIIADNGKGEIVDLLGVMGTSNSVVSDNTKRILYFLDNNNPRLIRQTSMNLGIRTEAAVINEKGIDPELMTDAFNYGIELYKKLANGKVVSKSLDIYPNKPKTHKITVSLEKINDLIGVDIDPKDSVEILDKLGFGVKKSEKKLEVNVPTHRVSEVKIPEDVIEEIARIYGYHNLPNIIPTFQDNKTNSYTNTFFYEEKIKNAMKYWGYTETYTYSLVSEDMYQGPVESGVKLKNPLNEDLVYLRNSLIPSLLKVTEENKSRDEIRIFELANIFIKNKNDLPIEKLTLSGILKKKKANFFEVKGLIEQLLNDLGIKNYKFKEREEGGAEIHIGKDNLGYIEIFNPSLIDFELEFDIILKHATLKKIYKPLAKFPPITEDMTFELPESINTQDVIEEIKLQNFLIKEVSLKDQYENNKTFHIIYQSDDKNLTNSEVKDIREDIIKTLKKKFEAIQR